MIPQPNKTWEIIDTSKICSFMECPRKYFYEYVLGWRLDFPNNHLIFGEAWHLAMEHLYLKGFGDVQVVEAHALFEQRYRRDFSPETDEMFYPKTSYNAFIVLGKYAAHVDYKRDHEIYEVLYTEIAGTVSLLSDRVLYFRMDTILRKKSNNMVRSLEHKTASKKHLWAEQWYLAMQPGSYNHVLHCLYPEDQVDGVEMNCCYFINRKKDPYDFQRVEVFKTIGQMQVWYDNINYYFQRIEHNMEVLDKEDSGSDIMLSFPMRQANCLSYFRLCEYHDFCTAWMNPLEKCHSIPIGFKEEFWNPMEREAKHKFEV